MSVVEGGGEAAQTTIVRLESQVRWYVREGDRSRTMYFTLKWMQVLFAAAIPVMTSVETIRTDAPWLIAAVGGAIVVLESFQQLGHYHDNWLRYGLAKESLRREEHLYMARAGDYAHAPNPDQLLALRVEELLAGEIRDWVEEQREADADARQAKDGTQRT